MTYGAIALAVGVVNERAAEIILEARFLVTNNSAKAARTWNVQLEVIPSHETLLNRFRLEANPNSTDAILPTATAMKCVSFVFRALNESFPFPFAYRALMETEIRFHTLSEDFVGEPQSQLINSVVDSEMLYWTIEQAMKKEVPWFR